MDAMEIAAVVRSGPRRHEVTVLTDERPQELAVPPKATGGGSAINGGEFLMLALATCYCNDLYREAARLKLNLDSVEVEATAVFDGVGLAARDIRYRAQVRSPATREEIERLLRETDAVAEVHNTVRQGTPVTFVLPGEQTVSTPSDMRPVTAKQLAQLRAVVDRYPPAVLRDSKWREAATEDDVWIRIVSQVVVVGNARPEEELQKAERRARLSWAKLSHATDEEARQAIWQVLRDIGARYAGKQADKCAKTAAILQNLRVLARHPGGPVGFLRRLGELDGTEEMIGYVTRHLSYVKNKGARDLLTSGFGLATDRIALDVRVLGALRRIGLDVPDKAPSDPEEYAALEKQLLDQVCRPLGISGAQLDQLLFGHYKDIKKHNASRRG
jgi:organic hydroperoxide reductase OsmC/OhrA